MSRSRTPRRADQNTVAQFAYSLRDSDLDAPDRWTALHALIDVIETDDNEDRSDTSVYYRRGYLTNLGMGILRPAPVKCTHCGEADNSKGAHGINRCVSLSSQTQA